MKKKNIKKLAKMIVKETIKYERKEKDGREKKVAKKGKERKNSNELNIKSSGGLENLSKKPKRASPKKVAKAI